MNMSTWNLFNGASEIALILLAGVGFMSVVLVVATAGRRVNKREMVLSKARKLINDLEAEERVLNDTKIGLTDTE